jgi:ribonuclease E
MIRRELSVSRVADDAWAVLYEDGAAVEIRPPAHPFAPLGRVFRAGVARREPALGTFLDLGEELQGLLRDSDRLADDAGLTVGQRLPVQVAREPSRGKGPRMRRRIRLAGPLLVLEVPGRGGRLSRRVGDADRARLRQVLAELPQGKVGWVARAQAAAAPDALLRGEAERLLAAWRAIASGAASAAAPAPLYDSGPLERIFSELPLGGLRRVVVDDAALAALARELLLRIDPPLATRVELQRDRGTLLGTLLAEVEAALRPRTTLASGGELTIEPTEALVSVDVDSAGCRGESAATVALATNLEAVVELARRLRLLDLGGTVIVDPIDLRVAEDREQVRAALRTALSRDRATVRAGDLDADGGAGPRLLFVVRERRRQDLIERLTRACPTCGSGHRVAAPVLVAARVVAELRRRGGCGTGGLRVSIHPSCAAAVRAAARCEDPAALVVASEALAPDRFEIDPISPTPGRPAPDRRLRR